MPRDGKCVIHWFRRDLRLADNTALSRASASGLPVVPVHILSEWKGEHSWTGSNRQQFLCDCLAELSSSLDAISGNLILRKGDPIRELEKLAKETGASAIYLNKDPDPHGKKTEELLRAFCQRSGIDFHTFDDVALHHPSEVLTQAGAPYKVFTPYSRNWLGLEKPAPVAKPSALNTPRGIRSLELPKVSHWKLDAPSADLIRAGEKAARLRMRRAIRERLADYEKDRDFPARDGTSRLSQDLRFGLISIRTLYAESMAARSEAKPAGKKGIDVFIKELAWREFYFAILHHFPEVLDVEFNPDWRGLWWAEPGKQFEAWKEGRTGFPIVDAGMRELLATGFMHNRVRMITAMFLTKDLHIDWRLGESFFMQHLTDGEIASNNGGWQWSAGTGADAAPYFRIQNPWSQAARYDADGAYIKRWVPELASVDAKKLHTPPKDGGSVAPGYPAPIVDHKAERERTLEIFKRHRAKRG
ncbi:deoxyribodipyrimidine photo-lyase [Luteolibacter sp. SL250]|uniref:cryptochrome/photolyase family protein n=1 Tax=Luteolibacter sp. SL250 TaxID=2995170 RepID=UPI00226F0DD3|nr:deoxyribodipyrimidine photo-lyase [Luteolibacter sp. SL250]WAC21433.1 deoxyribodipyrimidine photo-lyase [Luteolibacter sp. SL250]